MKIAFVNMPFSSLQIPSIALHQLETVTHETFGDACDVSVHYLNHDFGALVGQDLYRWISESLAGHTCGFGEWLFRLAAFPEEGDNSDAYFRRYALHFGADNIERYQRELAPVRARLPEILDEMIDRHGLAEADLVGLTSMFFQNVPSFALARRIKARNPASLIIIGGANCEANMGIEIVNNVPSIDFAFSGHALLSFPDFLKRLMAGDSEGLHHIDGVFSRRNSRSVIALADADRSADPGSVAAPRQISGIKVAAPERRLDQVVALDYDGYLESYTRHFGHGDAAEIELLFETSRGCWWGEKAHCTFCGLNGATMSFREMGVDKARQSVQAMIDRYVGRAGRFASVDNIIPRSYLEGLLPHLKVPDDIVLFYEVKADLGREQLNALARARVVEIQPGIESLSTTTLKLMRKGTTAFNNIRFLADCAAEGVKPIWNLLTGFPGEAADTYEMYARNLPRLMHLPPPSGVFPVRFDRFSPYFMKAQDYGLDLAPLDYHDLIYPFPAEVTTNLAYYFRDMNIDASYQTDLAGHITTLRQLVARWRDRWTGSQPRPRLRLVKDDVGFLIEDSRSGHMVEYELGDDDVALLRATGAPQSAEETRAAHGEAYQRMAHLGLLFEERGRVMTIVFEGLRHDLDSGSLSFGGTRGRAEAAALGLTF